jgi:hypothetical protein
MSTTTDKRTAFAYSGVRSKRGTVFEIQAGRVDVGASISFLSQYPGEAEYLMQPLCCLEVCTLLSHSESPTRQTMPRSTRFLSHIPLSTFSLQWRPARLRKSPSHEGLSLSPLPLRPGSLLLQQKSMTTAEKEGQPPQEGPLTPRLLVPSTGAG